MNPIVLDMRLMDEAAVGQFRAGVLDLFAPFGVAQAVVSPAAI
jgi:hypothetical protein